MVWGPGGYGEGYTGVLPSYPAPREEDPIPSGAGPGTPAGGGVGGEWGLGACPRVRWAGRLLDHPAGPVGALWAPPCPGPSECPPRAKRATFHLISHKVSQKARVSPKYVEKAYHSPCFQNGVQKSPLEKLRFPYSPAFSHKELIGPF